MKLAREKTKIKVTGRSFYRKKNLKFEGKNWNLSQNRIWSRNRTVDKKFGTWNRNRNLNRNLNLGKMARFRNTVYMHLWEVNRCPPRQCCRAETVSAPAPTFQKVSTPAPTSAL
jgi:hypothetical protein